MPKDAKPTVFVDVDGLLLVHHGGGASDQWYSLGLEARPIHQPPAPRLMAVDGARKLLDEMERRGWCVVLTTARKKCARKELKRQLHDLRLHYDKLVTGITSGFRMILNDAKASDKATCGGMTLPRNGSLNVDVIIAAVEDHCK